MTVRPAVESDVPAVLALIRRIPELPQWEPSALGIDHGERVTEGGPLRRLFLAEQHGVPVGFAQTVLVLDEAELEGIAVDPARQRCGVGRLLLQEALRTARGDGAVLCRLEVRASNAAALGLYRRAGFDRVGRRRDYYAHPVEDAVVLAYRWTETG